jgi:hypothetical protein
VRLSGSGRVRRNESPAPAGEILADDELDRIVGGKSVRTSKRLGPSKKRKLAKRRKGC